MHSYLRAVGFSNYKHKIDIDNLTDKILTSPTEIKSSKNQDNIDFYEIRKDFGNNIGISLRGEYSEDGKFEVDYYYPYFIGEGITSDEIIEIEKHAEKESYAGVCDDVKVGVSIIFYLQNIIDYFVKLPIYNSSKLNVSTTLSALSLSGKILFPIVKDSVQMENTRQTMINRNHLIAAARQGDEEAIESLTLEDIDTYTMISRKIMHEDVFSIVDTFFMPYGIESDQYSIMGEIIDVEKIVNNITNEKLYKLTIDCSDLVFDVCINNEDLLGEPAIGRRFKGIVWIQGRINFND